MTLVANPHLKSLMFAASFTLGTVTCAYACPTQSIPGMKATTVGEDITVNGLPVSIMQVEGKGPAANVLAQVERQWKRLGYQVKRSQAGGWDIVSALENNCMVTLQLIDRSGAFGYLSQSHPDKIKALRVQASGVPIPGGTQINSTVASNDDGRKGVILALTTSQTVESLQKFYMQRLREEKWGSVKGNVMMDKSKNIRYALVTGQRQRERIEVVIWKEQQVQVIVNMAESL